MRASASIATTTFILAIMFAAAAFGNTIGLSYTQIIDDRSLGINGDYQSEVTDRVTLEVEGNAQAGDIINARLNTNLIIDVSAIDMKVLVENKMKGYSVDTLGREQSVGVALSVPVEELNFDIGIGGKNASPFSALNAFDTLTAAGFAERDLTDRGLEVLTPPATGIPFKNGSTINAFVTTGFPLGIFDIDVKGTLELIGEGDRMHQVNTRFKTSGDLGKVHLTTAIEVGLAFYGDVIYREIATVTTAGIKF